MPRAEDELVDKALAHLPEHLFGSHTEKPHFSLELFQEGIKKVDCLDAVHEKNDEKDHQDDKPD